MKRHGNESFKYQVTLFSQNYESNLNNKEWSTVNDEIYTLIIFISNMNRTIKLQFLNRLEHHAVVTANSEIVYSRWAMVGVSNTSIVTSKVFNYNYVKGDISVLQMKYTKIWILA